MAQFNDPRMPNYGRANYGQLAPNRTAALGQQQQTDTNQQPAMSPMRKAIARAPQTPAPQFPQSPKPAAATGTFGPKTNLFDGIKRRQQTDFGLGGWQGGFNLINRISNAKGPFGGSAAISGRRAKGSNMDVSAQDAGTVLQRGYQDALGRQASQDEIQSQLSAQGLKPGDRWVGDKGLNAILDSLYRSEEALGRQPQNPVVPPSNTYVQDSGFEQPRLDVQEAGPTFESPMAAGLQPQNDGGAQQAYQEYLTEFGPDDPEQPIDFETFAGYYSQMPQEESPMESALSGRRGWENLLLDTQGEMDTPMSFSGFNMDRALAGGDPNSVKDAFARAASTFDTDLRGLSKQEVGSIIGSPEFHKMLAAQGIQSRPIPGAYDQIEVFTKERGWEVKDIVANAGSPDAQWWWGDVGGTPDPTQDMTDFGLEETTSNESGTDTSAMLSALGGSNWKTLLEQLMGQYRNG